MNKTVVWFDEEQKLFEKNSELIRMALAKAMEDEKAGNYNSQYYKAIEEIHSLDMELKRALQKHSELLSACMELQKTADELVTKAKLRSLRTSFDFENMNAAFMRQDRADLLSSFVLPLLKPKINKSFDLKMIDELLSYRPLQDEKAEVIEEEKIEAYVFDDEIEEERIQTNFFVFLKLLFDMLLEKESFEVGEFLGQLEKKYGSGILKSSDLYVFLVHLCQKKEYELSNITEEKDTFLDGVIAQFLDASGENRTNYVNLEFGLKMKSDAEIQLDGGMEISSFEIGRKKNNG